MLLLRDRIRSIPPGQVKPIRRNDRPSLQHCLRPEISGWCAPLEAPGREIEGSVGRPITEKERGGVHRWKAQVHTVHDFVAPSLGPGRGIIAYDHAPLHLA